MSDYFKIRALTNWEIDKSLNEEKFGVKDNGKDAPTTPLSQEIRNTIRGVGEDLKRFNNSPESEKKQIKGEILHKLETISEDIKAQKNFFDQLKNLEDVKNGLEFAQKLESKLANIQALCIARFREDGEVDERVMKDGTDAELFQGCLSGANKAMRQLTFSKNFKYAELVEAKKTISSRVDSALKNWAEKSSKFKAFLTRVFGWKAADAVKLLEKNEQELRDHVEKLKVLDPKDPYFKVSLEASEDAWNELKKTAEEYVNLGITDAGKIAKDPEIDACLEGYRALLAGDAILPENFTHATFETLYNDTKDSRDDSTPENLAKLSNKAAIALGVLEILWDKLDENWRKKGVVVDEAFLETTKGYADKAEELQGYIILPENESDPEKAKTWKFAQETAQVIKAGYQNFQGIKARNDVESAESEKKKVAVENQETKKYNDKEQKLLAQGREFLKIYDRPSADSDVNKQYLGNWVEEAEKCNLRRLKNSINSPNAEEMDQLYDKLSTWNNDLGQV